MTTAFQSDAFQSAAFQIDTGPGITGVLALTLGDISFSASGNLGRSGSLALSLADVFVSMTGTGGAIAQSPDWLVTARRRSIR